ncbi:hypothetical protein [Pseudomonas huanghezhanensis]|uniref:hypothetical protein n=1 Tax=Pseudomonas huanghezhanensis TaxID=3002903 RepID=UPI0022862C80|nr:hypothetical protein [Pseudomonas sp. BSw22131]
MAIKAFLKRGHWHQAMNQQSARIIQINCEKNANCVAILQAQKKPPACVAPGGFHQQSMDQRTSLSKLL